MAATFQKSMQTMRDDINNEFQETKELTGIARLSLHVEQAFLKTLRHKFVDEDIQSLAYISRPLPIGYGQTISQPFIVALMTELLSIEKTDKVLEVGTGSGFQAAILSHLANQVFTIEVVPELAAQAWDRLKNMGYNVHVKIGNGAEGWIQNAPYDKIIVTAASEIIPPELIRQLKPGGKMVIPLGQPGEVQMLTVVEKNQNNEVSRKNILPVVFVPFM